MSVYITFESHNESGVVAEGTSLMDAAKRLGASIPAECHGKGECDSCAVIVKDGVGLLSLPTTAELERLSKERLDANQRLACQTRVERSGELVLMSPPPINHEETVDEKAKKFREEFRELPLKRKLTRLAEFEAVSAFEALTELASLPFTVGEKVLDVIAGYERKRRSGKSEKPVDGKGSDDERVKKARMEEPFS